MNYILTTEVSPIPIYQEPKQFTSDEMVTMITSIHLTPIDLNMFNKETMPCYISQKISEETFKFIESVATIEMKKFGEKTYKINNIEFTILTEKEHKNRYGDVSTTN